MGLEGITMTMCEALKRAIADSGLTWYQLEKGTGGACHRASLMRFCAGKHVLRLDKADALAAFLGITVTPPKRKGR
jgi:hypothetical protein